MTERQVRNFNRKVDQRGPNECWPWKASVKHYGYGKIRLIPKTYASNRIAYFLANGVDPGELKVLHTCDNPPCCNPAHLQLGTQRDNIMDMVKKGRGNYAHDALLHGEKNPRAKLTNESIAMIRDLREGGLSYAQIAKQVGATLQVTISGQSIFRVLNRKTWKHIAA